MWIAFEKVSADILLWLLLYTNCCGSLRKAAFKRASTQIWCCCCQATTAAKAKGWVKAILRIALLSVFPWLGSHTLGSVIWLNGQSPKGFQSKTFKVIAKFKINANDSFLCYYHTLRIIWKIKGRWDKTVWVSEGTSGSAFWIKDVTIK